MSSVFMINFPMLLWIVCILFNGVEDDAVTSQHVFPPAVISFILTIKIQKRELLHSAGFTLDFGDLLDPTDMAM